ncbi:hypothetical protein [Natronorarus salvus]|uniref:hypothetical protein n=1 Tax=Natronorarus salvus TaxID=3117733 RepID=UPI002F2657FC
MTDPAAEPEDVESEYPFATVEEPTIGKALERTARDIYRVYDPEDFEDDTHRSDFEAALTALRLLQTHERPEESVDSGRSSIDYLNNPIADLRARIRRLDPGDEFGSSVIRNTDRHVRSTRTSEAR